MDFMVLSHKHERRNRWSDIAGVISSHVNKKLPSKSASVLHVHSFCQWEMVVNFISKLSIDQNVQLSWRNIFMIHWAVKSLYAH